MANLPDTWGWWGNEGGHRLDVTRTPNGGVLFGITTAHQEQVFVTLANFRVRQLRDWLNVSAAAEDALIAGRVAEEKAALADEHREELRRAIRRNDYDNPDGPSKRGRSPSAEEQRFMRAHARLAATAAEPALSQRPVRATTAEEAP